MGTTAATTWSHTGAEGSVTDTFNGAARRLEKQRARERDLAEIAAGRATPAQVRDRNGFFNALDPSRARVGGRRRIRIEIESSPPGEGAAAPNPRRRP